MGIYYERAKQMNFDEFQEKHKLALFAEKVAYLPNRDDKWEADHWLVTLQKLDTSDKRRFTTSYSKGKGLRMGGKPVKPSLREVVECLQQDATDLAFEDWADDYDGLAAAEALEIYQACRKTTVGLLKMGILSDLRSVDFDGINCAPGK